MVVAVEPAVGCEKYIELVSRFELGKKVHVRRQICIFIGLLTVSSVGSASPFVAAYATAKGHSPSAMGRVYTVNVARLPDKGQLTPISQFLLPVTASAFSARDWVIMTKQGAPCYIPDGSLLTITALTTTRLVAALQWPNEYTPGVTLCPDREIPRDGHCYGGAAANVNSCANGQLVIVDWSEAVDSLGRIIDPATISESLKSVLRN